MKELLKKLKQNWLDYLIIFISVGAICFVYLFTAFYQPKESDKNINNENIVKVLRDKKNRINTNDILYINLITDNELNNLSSYYYNTSNTQVNDANYRTTPRVEVFGSTSYGVGNVADSPIYISYYNANVVRLSTITTTGGIITTPSNARYVRIGTLATIINQTYFYEGNHFYSEYIPPLERILNSEYDEGYNDGYKTTLKNIFTSTSFTNPMLLILDDTQFVDIDTTDYPFERNLFFKDNYIDLQYLRSLNVATDQYVILWDNSEYLLSDLFLTIPSSVSTYNIQVNQRDYVIDNDGLRINLSDRLESLKFDSTFLMNSELINYSVVYTQGFNKGYNQALDIGHEIGYHEGLEYGQQLGYNNGYNDGVASASNNFNIMDFLRSLFDLVWGALNVEMLPNIKLMYIVSIPLILSVIKFILGWFR